VQVRDHREELGLQPSCVTFAIPELLVLFERELDLGYPVYGDPDRNAYAAFGFGRGSVGRVWLHPRVWARYAKLIARGERFRAAEQDTLQLGGDVIASDGVVRWVYRSRGPDDRPSIEQLRRAAAAPAA
jgi:hypothetical protein